MRGGHPRERGGVQEAHVQHAGLQVVYIVPFFFFLFYWPSAARLTRCTAWRAGL